MRIYKKKKNSKKKIICKKKKLTYENLLQTCDIGLSTVMIDSKILKRNLFSSIKTKEDYVLWLKITKQKIYAYNMGIILATWNNVTDSLSSNIFQKFKDGFLVYNKYQGFNFIKSFFYLIILSINSLKK